MQKVANCPVCKKKPFPYHYEDHTEYVHCGVKCEDEGTWNSYATAMELAIATVAYFTLATEAGHKRLQEAGQRVLEVFK